MTALRPRRRSPLGTLPVLAVLLSACGPSTPLKTGLAPVDLNVRLGNYATPAAPQPPQPPPFAELMAGFPQPFVPAPAPLPTLAAPPFTPGPACPTAPPFAFPLLGATQVPSAPPVAGRTYAFRYVGTYTSGGRTTTYPGSGTRTIANVKPNNVGSLSAYQFDVVEKWNGYTTTTTYLVIPNSPSPENVPVSNQAPAAGIYLTQQSSAIASGSSSPDVFDPSPMLQVMSFPAAPGAPVGGTGSDAPHGASETIQPSGQGPVNEGYSQLQSPAASTPTPAANVPLPPAPEAPVAGSQVQGDARVDACGTTLDSWQVDLIGSYTSASLGTYSFDDTYDFATEYGGIPIAEHHHATGTRTDGSSFSFDVTATIDEVPATPSS
ncbi:MAG TPA: hypothetical protein VFC09_01925 [Candidatus Dormibacteraeota bacterium]|nr:hypothetical protein [Candidatus Dormibacteraeota bacterium]